MSSDQLEAELRSIEHALHAALVRQLRVISLMAVLLGVAGFFVGHFVAAEQGQASLTPLERQVAELQEQLAAVTDRCVRQETAHSQTVAALQELDMLRREDASRDAAALNALMTDIQQRRALSLQDLEKHVAQRTTMPPEAVTAAINRFVDEHLLQLDRALAIVEGRMDQESIAASRAPLPPIEQPEATTRPTTTPGSLSPLTDAGKPEHNRDSSNFTAPPAKRKGYLFISRNQPQRLDPVRISESDEIPLPPR